MKLAVLIENTASREGLTAEHGLSLYLEVGERKLLFDAGASGAFADNARVLGVDLKAVDTAVLSHGHYDHGGGLGRFFRENRLAKCYVNKNALGQYYNASGKYIGLARPTEFPQRLILTEGTVDLGPGLTLFPGKETGEAVPGSLQVMEAGVLRPDDFSHEQYLLIEEGGKRILISGCSHRGVARIMERFRPDVLVGGFHTKDVSDGETLEALARELAAYPAVYYTCHCTGQGQFAAMGRILGQRLRYLGTGDRLEL